MNKEMIDIDLKGVPQTLLVPLLGRAKCSQLSNPPIYDSQAIKLIEMINYDFDKLFHEFGYSKAMWLIARAYQFDLAIKCYLEKHPEAVIVNLGAGLDTTFYRVDNGTLTWIDLDFTDVIALRNKLLKPHDRVHSISKSILDFTWIHDVKQLGSNFFFIAGGLFMYFTEDEVKSILVEMSHQFQNTGLIFDSIPKNKINLANRFLEKSNMSQAKLKWGLDYGTTLEKWSENIKLVSQVSYFKPIKSKHYFPISIRLQMYFYDLFKKGGIIHLRFIK